MRLQLAEAKIVSLNYELIKDLISSTVDKSSLLNPEKLQGLLTKN
jgi:hypothetical protein